MKFDGFIHLLHNFRELLLYYTNYMHISFSNFYVDNKFHSVLRVLRSKQNLRGGAVPWCSIIGKADGHDDSKSSC